jgi:ATP-dependent Lon protease
MSMFSDASETPVADRLPVMVLGGATLFPNTLLPLFIFEPRYRAMLTCALETDRLIAIAQPEDDSEKRLRNVAGVGLIRACVQNKDGTSHLVLQGVQRVRFSDWEQLKPFRIAKVEVLRSIPIGETTGTDLLAELLSIITQLKMSGIALPDQFGEQLAAIDSVDIVTDIACATLVSDPLKRQALLEELDSFKRLQFLLSILRSQSR